MSTVHKMERALVGKGIDGVLHYVNKDPEDRKKALLNLVDVAQKVAGPMFQDKSYDAARAMISDENGKWYQYVNRLLNEVDPHVLKMTALILGFEAAYFGTKTIREKRKELQCQVPWLILMDPTSACNMHCTGCWAAEYGHKLNLSYEDIDSIINQGVELGIHIYIYTGGEPLVRKKDLIRLCEAHPDCSFLCFTNSTLIDEEFCQDMIRVKNFVPAISAEGSEETTDARRGEGVYQKVSHAMALLREHGLPFGVSACITSANADTVGSEEFIDWMIDQGALFCWVFNYMPVGMASPADLMLTVEQRERMYRFVREMREKKPLFLMDFQNDGEFVGGCIAGGRRYLHINAAGDVEPCVFIHYSNANIHDMSLLECLKSPIFMQYYEGQPFNDNLLRPCPMLENPQALESMVEKSGAKCTDLQEEEPVEHLCGKCKDFAQEWAPVAEKLWENPADPRYPYRRNITANMADTDKEKFEKQNRKFARL